MTTNPSSPSPGPVVTRPSFSELLFHLRTARGRSAETVAEEAGLALGVYSAFEDGSAVPDRK